jgi:hypothetical protein
MQTLQTIMTFTPKTKIPSFRVNSKLKAFNRRKHYDHRSGISKVLLISENFIQENEERIAKNSSRKEFRSTKPLQHQCIESICKLPFRIQKKKTFPPRMKFQKSLSKLKNNLNVPNSFESDNLS